MEWETQPVSYVIAEAKEGERGHLSRSTSWTVKTYENKIKDNIAGILELRNFLKVGGAGGQSSHSQNYVAVDGLHCNFIPILNI